MNLSKRKCLKNQESIFLRFLLISVVLSVSALFFQPLPVYAENCAEACYGYEKWYCGDTCASFAYHAPGYMDYADVWCIENRGAENCCCWNDRETVADEAQDTVPDYEATPEVSLVDSGGNIVLPAAASTKTGFWCISGSTTKYCTKVNVNSDGSLGSCVSGYSLTCPTGQTCSSTEKKCISSTPTTKTGFWCISGSTTKYCTKVNVNSDGSLGSCVSGYSLTCPTGQTCSSTEKKCISSTPTYKDGFWCTSDYKGYCTRVSLNSDGSIKDCWKSHTFDCPTGQTCSSTEKKCISSTTNDDCKAQCSGYKKYACYSSLTALRDKVGQTTYDQYTWTSKGKGYCADSANNCYCGKEKSSAPTTCSDACADKGYTDTDAYRCAASLSEVKSTVGSAVYDLFGWATIGSKGQYCSDSTDYCHCGKKKTSTTTGCKYDSGSYCTGTCCKVSATCGSSSVGYWKCNPTTGTWTTSTTYSDSSCTTKCGSSSATTCTFTVTPKTSSGAALSASVYYNGAFTRTDTEVELINIPVGTHTISATKDGYQPVSTDVTCPSSGGKKTVTLTMTASSSITGCKYDSGSYCTGTCCKVSATCGSSSVGYWKCNPTTGTWTTSTTYSDSSCTTKCGSSSSTTCTFVVNSLELPSRAAVSSAKIYLDGADTNKQGSLVTLENVPVGTHTLKATAKGYNDVTLSAPCTSAGGVKTYYMLFESSSSKPACTTSGACSGYAIASGCSAQASSSGFSSTYTWTKATSSSCSGSTPYCYCGKLKSSSTKTCQEACGGTFLCSATTPTGYTYKSSGDSYCKSINSALKCYCAKSSGSGDDEDNHPSWVTGCAEFCKWVNTGYASSCRTSCVDDSSWWRNHYAEADKYCAANQVCCCSVQRTGGSSSKSVSCSSYTSIDRDIHCDCDNERACYPWGVWSLSNADWYKAQCFQCCQAETCGQGSSGSKSSKEPNWDEPPGEQTPEDQGEEGDCPNLCANYNPAGWYSCQDSCTANGLHYLSGGDSYCQNEHEGNTAGNHCCCTPTGEDDDDSDGNSGDRTCQREAEIDIDFEESSYCAGRGNFFDLTIQFEYDGDEYDMNEGDFRVVVSGNCINTRTLKAYSDRDVFRDRGDGEFELEGGTYWFGDVCRRTFEVTGKFKDGSRSCEITESQSVNVRDCGDDDDDEPSTTCDEACNGRDWDCDDSCRDDEDHESDGDDWCEWDDSDNDRCCCEVEEEDDEPPTTCAEACGNRDSDCDDSCSDDEERERDGDDWCEWDDSDNDRCCCEVEEEQTETCEEACDGRDWDCDDSCSDDEEHESDGDDDCRAGERCCCEEGDGDDDDGETGEMNCVVTGCIESTITCDGTACSMPSLPCGGGIFSCNGPFACSGGTCTCRDATCQGKGTPDENDGEDDDQDDPQETQIKVDCPETCNNDEPCTCTIEGCLRGVAQFSGNALDIRTMVTKYHEIPIKILTRSPDTISIHPGNSGTLAFEAMCINPMANSDEVRISVN